MADVPRPMTLGSGPLVSTEFNAGVRDPLAFLLARPMAELVQSVAQPLTTGVWTSITFDVEQFDNDPTGGSIAHDTAVNNSRFTAVYPGWYTLTGAVGFALSAAGFRGTRWMYNGSVIAGSELLLPPVTTIAPASPARTKRVYLAPFDYVELQGFQNTGGALNTLVTAELQSSMGVLWERNA